MRIVRYIGLGLLAYLIFLVATLPAALAYPYVKDRLAPLKLYGIEGSIWSGQAQMADLGSYRLGVLNWHAHPWTLFLGRVELAWDNGPGQGRGILARKFNGNVQARDVTLTLPLPGLAALVRNLPFKADGSVKAVLANLEAKGPQLLAVDGTLSWNDAAFLVPQPLKLGSFDIKLSTEDTGIKGILRDRGGPVQAQGIVLLKHDGHYQFSGSLAQHGVNMPQLQQILAFAGQPGPDGRIPISVSGVLPGSTQPVAPSATAVQAVKSP